MTVETVLDDDGRRYLCECDGDIVLRIINGPSFEPQRDETLLPEVSQ